MKKIVLISASPRRGGNSDVLSDEFARGAKEAGAQAEKIFLSDYKIRYCTGCGLCNNREGICSQKDDMAGLLEKVVAADVIVLATPVYFYTMDAQLKTFIDRCCPRYTEMSDKDCYFIVTAADEDVTMLERTADGMQGFLDCLDGANLIKTIYGAGMWQIGEAAKSDVFAEAYAAGRDAAGTLGKGTGSKIAAENTAAR